MSRNVYINNIQAFLPNAPVGNDDMEAVLGQIGSRPSRARRTILRSNKIVSRHYAVDRKTRLATHTNAQLTAQAVRQLNSDIFNIDNIDLLACGTTIADQLLPNHASMVHGELAIPSCEVLATAGICLSGMMSLKYGYMSVLCGLSKNAVATGSEIASAIMRAENFREEVAMKCEALEARPEIAFEKDFLRWMLSDGAGAVLMNAEPNSDGPSIRIDWIEQRSYANELDACMYAGAVKQEDGSLKGWLTFEQSEWLRQSMLSVEQDVKLLNEEVINYTVTKPLKELVASGQVDPDRVDYFLPHYSSGYFRDKVYQGMLDAECDIPQEKWFTNLATRGNTGSASIYIMLAELFHSGTLKPGDRLLCYVPESGRFGTAFMQLTIVQE